MRQVTTVVHFTLVLTFGACGAGGTSAAAVGGGHGPSTSARSVDDENSAERRAEAEAFDPQNAWEQIPESDRGAVQRRGGTFVGPAPFDDELQPILNPLSTVTLNLDSDPELEWVLAMDVWPDVLERCEGPCETRVWFFDNQDGQPRYAGVRVWEASHADPGTFDLPPGLAALRAERVADHDFLRIEHNNVNGSYDPRFMIRSLALLHLVGGIPVDALNLRVSEIFVAGPEREETERITRTIVYARDGTIGYSDSERNCRTTLRFDGRVFRTDASECYAEPDST